MVSHAITPRAAGESARLAHTATAVDAVRRVLRAMRIAERETLATSGLSAAQLFVLSSLVDGEDASLSELADRTLTDRSSVTAVVDRLLERRLVQRRVAAGDRRRAAIRLTTAGRVVLRDAPAAPTTMLLAGLGRMSAARLARLADGLVALTHAMDVAVEPPGMLFDDGTTRAPAARRHRSA